MNILKAILLGLLQGVTEFLPISSSGHLSLAQHLLGVSGDTSLLFTVMLHLGTLAAVFIVYYRTIWALAVEFFMMISDIIHKKFSFSNMSPTRRMLVMLVVSCLPLLILLIPTGGGMKLLDRVSVFSTDDSILAEGVCFIVTAVLLILGSLSAKNRKKRRKALGTGDALVVGIAQTVAAALPGVSRSGSTISTGLICGIAKETMVQYSFILGIPAILAASLMEFKDAVEAGSTVEPIPLIIGIAVAAVSGVLSIALLRWILKKDYFRYFGYYCGVLGIITVILGIIEKAAGIYIGIH